MPKLLHVAAGLAALFLAGCADFTTALVSLNDELGYQQTGQYTYADQHYVDDHRDKVCPYRIDYGVVSGRTYARARNYADFPIDVTLYWSTGSVSRYSLGAYETSETTYMSNSVHPLRNEVSC